MKRQIQRVAAAAAWILDLFSFNHSIRRRCKRCPGSHQRTEDVDPDCLFPDGCVEEEVLHGISKCLCEVGEGCHAEKILEMVRVLLLWRRRHWQQDCWKGACYGDSDHSVREDPVGHDSHLELFGACRCVVVVVVVAVMQEYR